MNNHINAVINEATKPTETDVLRCRRMILERLSSEDLVSAEELATAVARAEGLRPPERRQGAQLPTQSPSVEDVADLPAVLWSRWLLAGLGALGQLQARGTIMGCETPQGASVPNLAAGLTVGWQAPGLGSSTRITHPVPKLAASHYRLTPGQEGWFADPDVFLADIQLPLDDRTRRCVNEALDAWRSGLFLATANMLGAAFEGAWMAAGVELAALNPSIEKAVTADPPKVATVQKAVAGFLESRGFRAQSSDLMSHAGLLRDLRNYGIHPKPATDQRLERYLDEATSGLLILTTHHHLIGLADSTAAVLEG